MDLHLDLSLRVERLAMNNLSKYILDLSLRQYLTQ